MGKAIVYCQDCGRSLYEDDFERGRASRVDNRPYCSACRAPAARTPAPVPPRPGPATPRRGSTDRVPVFRPPPSTPRPFKAAAPRSPLLVWGPLAFLAVVAVIGLTLALAGRRPSTSPSPPAITEPTPSPRPRPEQPPVDRELELLRRLLAAPPAEWKRGEIDAALARRPDLAGPRKDYARGVLGLGLREGLIGHWTLDERDGTVARDSSGRGHDGRIVGDPRRVPGKVGGAFHFSGNNEDGVEISSGGELDLLNTKTFSLSLWFQPDSLPSGASDAANDAWYALLIRAGMHMGLSLDRQGRVEMAYWLEGPKKAFQTSNEGVARGSWTHVAAVVDSSTGHTRVYLNGRPSGETSWPRRSKVHRVASSMWRIGIAAPKAPEYGWSLRGAVDDVRIHARALAPEEIALLAEGLALPAGEPPGRTPSNEGLVLHLRSDTAVTTDAGGRVSGWEDVERKILTHSADDQRPLLRGGEILLDGKNDRVVYHHLPEHAFRETDSFTLRVKVRADKVVKGRYSGVFAKSMEKPPWYGIWTDEEGRWAFGATPHNLHGSAAKPGIAVVTAVQVGGREQRLYVDGALVASGPPHDASGAGDLWIGGTKGRNEYFNGALLEVQLWRRALSWDEVMAK